MFDVKLKFDVIDSGSIFELFVCTIIYINLGFIYIDKLNKN